MERFIQSLYDRLESEPENRNRLIGIMDGAINEMHNSGIFSKLAPEVQEKVHSDDPQERVPVKAAIAKDVARQYFIKASQPVPLNNGNIGHMVEVEYDESFINSICLCIQGGVDGLYLAEAYKKC
ncbi:MAG: hypothetical protein IJQ22_02985 [Bacteroidales bacterium]|nr:hypothetical protein [Bacteroidales bacterium]